MYHQIPGCPELKINRRFNIKPVNELDKTEYKKLFKLLSNKYIELEQYGKMVKRSLKWIYLLSLYRLNLPKGFEEYVGRYEFKKVARTNYGRLNSEGNKIADSRLPYEVVFREPVYYNKDFRIIAEYPEYAISENEKLINILTGELISFKYSEKAIENNISYPVVKLSNKATKALHRLVAVTWLINDDWENKKVVNHIDGNKYNFKSNNLEWVTSAENSSHAFANGLRDDNIPVKMYNSDSKTITVFASVRDAFKSFGAKPRSAIKMLFEQNNGFYIAKDKYEIRYLKDDRDFLLMTMSASDIKRKKSSLHGVRYQALNLSTKETIEGTDVKIAKEISAALRVIALSYLRKTVIKNWIIRNLEDKDKEWNIDEFREVENKPKTILATNQKDLSVIKFDSLRQASNHLGVDRKIITRFLGTDKIISGFKLSA